MIISPYINFQGQAKEAMAFYAKVLNTEAPQIMYFKELPPDPNMPIPDECGEWVMHGSIKIGDQLIMFSDVLPGGKYTPGDNISLLIDLEDMAELKAIYNAFCDGATINMPFGKTFWAQGYGSLTDKFGVEWQFNCSDPNET